MYNIVMCMYNMQVDYCNIVTMLVLQYMNIWGFCVFYALKDLMANSLFIIQSLFSFVVRFRDFGL